MGRQKQIDRPLKRRSFFMFGACVVQITNIKLLEELKLTPLLKYADWKAIEGKWIRVTKHLKDIWVCESYGPVNTIILSDSSTKREPYINYYNVMIYRGFDGCWYRNPIGEFSL